MTKIVLDGDLYAYQYAAAAEEYTELDGWLVPRFDLRRMRENWKIFLEDTMPPHDDLVIALSDRVNFRKTLGGSYKAHRSSPKPIMYKPFIDWMRDTLQTATWPGLEGDDVCGILATSMGFVIVSEDKDMKTLPATRYDLATKEFITQSQHDADRFWMVQTLTGDTTDGYSGLAGVGPKTAEKILSGAGTLEEMWSRVVSEYNARGSSEEHALLQARFARILRAGDYNLKTRTVNLWTPTK